MCLAIYKPATVRIVKGKLETGFKSNCHGAGFCYPEIGQGQLTVVKGLMTWDKFWESYEPHQDEACLIHFRWATHGPRDASMTHPFPIVVDKKVRYAIIHNGVIGSLPDEKNDSDTSIFVRDVMTPIMRMYSSSSSPRGKAADAIQWLIEHAVGTYNKIALMDYLGNPMIFNEKAGHWSDKCWFSNLDYSMPRWTPVAGGGRIVHYGSGWDDDTECAVGNQNLYQGALTHIGAGFSAGGPTTRTGLEEGNGISKNKTKAQLRREKRERRWGEFGTNGAWNQLIGMLLIRWGYVNDPEVVDGILNMMRVDVEAGNERWPSLAKALKAASVTNKERKSNKPEETFNRKEPQTEGTVSAVMDMYSMD